MAVTESFDFMRVSLVGHDRGIEAGCAPAPDLENRSLND
jgi:hypothetical protein